MGNAKTINEFCMKVLDAAKACQNEIYPNGCHALGIQRVMFPDLSRCQAKKLGISGAIQTLKRKGLLRNFRNKGWRGWYVVTDKSTEDGAKEV